jgi:hypothetical protein
MRYILIFLCLELSAQVARRDTIYTNFQIPFKADTININVLSNDSGGKVGAYYINCKRYAAGTTWRSITGLGKVRLLSTGQCTFIASKPPTITQFKYLLESGCGADVGMVYIRDSIYYFTADRSKVWVKNQLGWGYLEKRLDKYFIIYSDGFEEITEEKYNFAINEAAN